MQGTSASGVNMGTLPEQVTVQGLKSRDWKKHPSTEKHMTLHTTKILNLQDTYLYAASGVDMETLPEQADCGRFEVL
jgi:hypothetical protein